MRWTRSRRNALPLALAAALALGAAACHLFLDDWGWEGQPCRNSEQCNHGLECISADPDPQAEFGICSMYCSSHEQCEDRFGSGIRCDQVPDDSENRYCRIGQGVEEFPEIDCRGQEAGFCQQHEMEECIPLLEIERDLCTVRCEGPGDCPPGSACAELGIMAGGKFCIRPEWNGHFGVLCGNESDCGQDANICVDDHFYSGYGIGHDFCSATCDPGAPDEENICPPDFPCTDGSDQEYRCLPPMMQ
jgi:hypothetical protein